MISVCKLLNVESSTETASRKSMNNFKDPPKLICSLASSMLLLVMKLADLQLLLGQWKSDLEAFPLQLCKMERDASLFHCWNYYHSFLVVVRLVFQQTVVQNKFCVYGRMLHGPQSLISLKKFNSPSLSRCLAWLLHPAGCVWVCFCVCVHMYSVFKSLLILCGGCKRLK